MTTPAATPRMELSLRGLVLGILITVLFTAANVYLGLKVGLTVATSIPAAVISMAVLSMFRDATILENNIVQTVASAAGTLSAIIFVLPGLVIVGWWSGFPFWISFAVCASGGVLGVLFTIPLRRALVTTSDLPYPEGVAAAEVLLVGAGLRNGHAGERDHESRTGLLAVVFGALASAGMALLSATRIAAAELQGYYRFASGAVTGFDLAYSLALFGAGHLVGLSVGMAMLTGLLIAWAGAIPILTAMDPVSALTAADHALDIWSTQIRFLGVGTIAVASIWTLARLTRPVLQGLANTVYAARTRAAAADMRDTDLSPRWIIFMTLLSMAVAALLLVKFTQGTPLAEQTVPLVAAAVPFVLVIGFLIAAICGYMAGLIGASNSPVSGVGILAIVLCATLMLLVTETEASSRDALVAFSLFTTAIVFGVATISNNNLQDLKTGQLVGATPWRQQAALIVGVLAGSAVIPPVLNLLAEAYGFAGAANLATITAKPLPAPQAALISSLARGVIRHDLNWTMISIGAAIGVIVIGLDEFLGSRKRMRLPPLAVGIGIYLPMIATLAVVVGAVVGHWYKRRAAATGDRAFRERLGVLLASGFIVGESLFGVLLAGLIVAFNTEAPLALVSDAFPLAQPLGVIVFTGLVAVLYRWILRRNFKGDGGN